MPKFRLKISESERLFPAYGTLKNGDVVEAESQPPDGDMWSWTETTAQRANPVAEEPVVPDNAQPPVITDVPPIQA
jgi:hypothetical protein